MDISLFKMPKTKDTVIDTVEAFNLWNTLNAIYVSVETNQLLRSFVHDRDFHVLLGANLEEFDKHIAILEKDIKKYKVKAPVRPPRLIQAFDKIDQITDKLIYDITSAD